MAHGTPDEPGDASTRLAVYGTLAPGEVNHAMVADLRGVWRRGAVRGWLHPTGWGMTYGFPALRWDPDGPEVPVHLLTSADLPAAWGTLDRFEGEAYQRIVVPIVCDDATVLANIYVARDDA